MNEVWRRRRCICLAAAAGYLLLACGLSLARPDAPPAERSFVLDNGLRVFLYEKHELPLLNVVTAVNVGSKDETDETSGLVHILEHGILFAGTTSRSGDEVLADVRRHGAYFNAHTGQDLSLYELSLPSSEADFALENERNIIFDFALTPDRLEQEKAVILEELSQMEDDPTRSAVNTLMQHLFPGHPYGRPVAGRSETVRAATVDRIMAFHDRFFVPENCALVLVGDFKCQDMEEKVRRVFGPLKKSGFVPAVFPEAGLLKHGANLKEERDVEEAYVALGFVGPGFNHPDEYAMHLLVEILGRGINPLLNSALNSRRVLIKTMSMSYLANRYGGGVVVTFTLDPKNVAATIRDATTFLKRTYQQDYSMDDIPPEARMYAFDYLESAKNRIRFGSEQALESGLSLAESIARFTLLNTREDTGSYLEHVRKVSSSDIRGVASRYFSKGDFAVVTILPAKDGKKRT
jgi:zinc protease